MHIEIETTATIAKSVSIKREKGADDIELVYAHLKFSLALVSREVIDALCNMPKGWATRSFYDELGAPYIKLDMGLPQFDAIATGRINGVEGDHGITLAQADLTGVAIALYDKGGWLSGELTWAVAGDEVTDLEPLLGRVCMLHVVVQDSGQGDLLKAA